MVFFFEYIHGDLQPWPQSVLINFITPTPQEALYPPSAVSHSFLPTPLNPMQPLFFLPSL